MISHPDMDLQGVVQGSSKMRASVAQISRGKAAFENRPGNVLPIVP